MKLYIRSLSARRIKLLRRAGLDRLSGFRLPSALRCGIVGVFFSPETSKLWLTQSSKLVAGRLLLFADGKDVTHGNPLVSGAKVTAEVLEQRKDRKVFAFKYRRRKGYHRTVGHRRKLTRIKIKTIDLGGKKPAAKKPEE